MAIKFYMAKKDLEVRLGKLLESIRNEGDLTKRELLQAVYNKFSL